VNDTGPKPYSTFWTDVSLLSVAVVWGINAAVMKYGISHVDPFVFNSIRLTISAISLWFCLLLFDGPKHDVPLKAKPWSVIGWVLAFAIFSGAVYQITFLFGIFRTTAGNTALIMSSCPMWTAILAVILTKDQLSKVAWLGLSMALLGTVLVISQGGELSIAGATVSGNLIVLAAALVWATASVASTPMLKHVSTGVAYAMWNDGIKKVGAPHAAVYQNVIPLVALIGAWLINNEVPVALQLWGGASIIAGLIVMRRGRERP